MRLTATEEVEAEQVAEMLFERRMADMRRYATAATSLYPSVVASEVRAEVDWYAEQVMSLIAAREAAAEKRGRVAALREAADEVVRVRVHGLNAGESYGPHDRAFEAWLRERADREDT